MSEQPFRVRLEMSSDALATFAQAEMARAFAKLVSRKKAWNQGTGALIEAHVTTAKSEGYKASSMTVLALYRDGKEHKLAPVAERQPYVVRRAQVGPAEHREMSDGSHEIAL
jgi:hypothetical protein